MTAKKPFTESEQRLLKWNPYTYQVTAQEIHFAAEIKQACGDLYRSGHHQRWSYSSWARHRFAGQGAESRHPSCCAAENIVSRGLSYRILLLTFGCSNCILKL